MILTRLALVLLLASQVHAFQNRETERQAQELMKSGRILLQAGKTSEAQRQFQRAKALHSQLSKQYATRGRKQLESRAYDAAKKSFQHALEFDTQNPYAYLELGRIHLREKNYPTAIARLSQALTRNPDLSDARDLLKQALKGHHASDQTSTLRHYTFPGQTLAFKEKDSLRVEIAYALPKVGLAAAGGIETVHIDQQLVLSDSNSRHRLSFVDQLTHLPRAGELSLRSNYLQGIKTVRVPLKAYQLTLNIKDRKIASRGQYTSICRPPTDDIQFGISDLLMARNITSQTPFPESRSDLQINPNPLRLYHQSEPIFVYLELYNLLPSISGQTDYEISYAFQWPETTETDLRFFEALDRNMPLNMPTEMAAIALLVPHQHRQGLDVNTELSPVEATRVTIPYTGRKRNDFTYLQLTVDHLTPGIHKLIISARDLVAEETVQRATFVRIIK